MNTEQIVKELRKMLPPKEDYAELVASPVPSSYGQYYVWQDPEPYIINEAADLIESLQAQLAESQRRERAAVEDMKLIVDAVREAHGDETCCFACKFDCDTSITDSGCYANECPGFERDDCFEWRGPQGEGGTE